MKKKIYVAIPYSGNEEKNFKIANEVTAKLMDDGHIPFSPISHSHPIAIQCQVPGTWEYWEEFDRSFIEWADELLVVVTNQEEVDNSKGVQAEMNIAKELNKPINFYQYDRI